jgi:ABC-2 type transport system permease protein
MRSMLVLAWKDFRSLFNGPLFFVLSGLLTAFWAFNFVRGVIQFANRASQFTMMMRGQGQGPNLHFEVFTAHLSLVHLLLLLTIPALTMRLLAEEKKMGTFDLLMTSPISSWQIVVGKLLAGLGIVFVLLLLSAVFPLSVVPFTQIEWGPLISSYIGVFLLCAAYVGVGLLGSSLTRSVFLAIIISFILNVVIVLMGSNGPGESGMWADVAEYISVREHIVEFFKGSIRVTSFIFLFSLIGLSAFLTERIVESSRWR